MEMEMKVDQVQSFFQYLLAFNNLVGKVTRDYKDFEKNWHAGDLKRLDGCYILDECHDEGNILEIHRPVITEKDKKPPKPDKLFKDWLNLDFDYHKETANPAYQLEKTVADDEGNEVIEQFEDNGEREAAYKEWVIQWYEWANALSEKKQVLDLYETFFELIARFEKEGEALEFVYGSGILCWRHPDPKIGTIRHPLLTSKLELELNADRGVIMAKMVDDEIHFEQEMLSSVRIPNMQQINELVAAAKERTITDDLTDVFQKFIQLFDANGRYIEHADQIAVGKDPVVYHHSMFSLREKNTRVLRNDLEQIIEGLQEGTVELTDAIQSLIGDQTEENAVQQDVSVPAAQAPGKNELFFPLDANEQQKEIVNRIERNYGVTVQGPPGTGKTHTIANLVSHFLSEGKKVLITSQKESPLRVLKNKIPEEIRNLCVPVLGGGRESFQEIEESIRVISEKLGELDTCKLENEVKRKQEGLDQSKRNEAQLKNQLRDYAQKEGAELEYKGEIWMKYDVAKKLAETSLAYHWIQDDVAMDAVFPLSSPEFQELWQLREDLSKEDLLLHDHHLPKMEAQIPNSTSFASFIESGRELEQAVDAGGEIIERYALPHDESKIEQLAEDVQGTIKQLKLLEKADFKFIIEDVKAGGMRAERWATFSRNMEQANADLFASYNKLVKHQFQLPEKELPSIARDLEIAGERLEQDKKPNFFFFMFKGKQTKYLFEDAILNDRPVRNLDDIHTVRQYIDYLKLKKETTRVFNSSMEEIGLPPIDSSEKRFPHLLEERMQELNEIIDAARETKAFSDKMKDNHLGYGDAFSIRDNEQFVDELELAIKYLQSEKWQQQYAQSLENLKSLKEAPHAHPIFQDFVYAYENKDVEAWNQTLESLQGMEKEKPDVNRFYQLLKAMGETLPLTAKSMEVKAGEDIPFPNDYKEAFELRKLQTWLDETKNMDVSKLKNQIEAEHKEQKRLIREIVTASTWKKQVDRITDTQKRALSAWKSSIKRFGKGTGKYASVYLKEARTAMKTAQNAIPVWIMPINQVLENFPATNEKFDVIIFDESSQCDVFSVNVLLRGKKAIVVGDEEQISPQSIGVKLEDVHDLVRRYLPDVPNGTLYDGNISLYEIAEQTFPKEGKLMLREHFRCVPEIIQFSNDLSYGGEMIPLRLPTEGEKIEPPVAAVKVDDGYNDAKNKDMNVPEADAIVADMAEMIHDPGYADQTFGVIALQGKDQAKILETKIREEIGDSEFVKRKIICGDAYTLQGDERDVIFLSMVIAPNRNFTARTKAQDKQRFNVAASRAKNQMLLYHSVDLEDLNPIDLRYSLLSYCKHPTRVNEAVEDLEGACDSPFEVDVLRMIIAKGYKVTPQVQVGRYRIDLVVEGLRDRLAVECDGEKWHGPEKFEEDMQRQETLERAGWKFFRIRGREFYLDRTNAMESLWEQLDHMGIEQGSIG